MTMAEDDAFDNPKFPLILILGTISYLSVRLGIWSYQADRWIVLALCFLTFLSVQAFFLFFVIKKITNSSNSFMKKSLAVLIICLWIIAVIDLFKNQFGFYQLINRDGITIQISEKEPRPNEEVTISVKISLKYYCAITEIIFKPDASINDSLIFRYDGIPGVISGGTDQHSTSLETFQYTFTNLQNPRYSKIYIKYETILIELGGYRIIEKNTNWLSLFPN